MATVLTFQKPKIWVFVWEITDSEICHFKITAWLFFEMFCFVSTSWRNVSSTNKIVWNVFFDYSKSAKPYWIYWPVRIMNKSQYFLPATTEFEAIEYNLWNLHRICTQTSWLIGLWTQGTERGLPDYPHLGICNHNFEVWRSFKNYTR